MRTEPYFRLDDFIHDYAKEDKIVIFGTGLLGKELLSELKAQGVSADFFTTNTERRFGTRYCDLEVKRLSDLPKENTFYIIAIQDAVDKRNVMHQLLNFGIAKRYLVIPLILKRELKFDTRLEEIPEFAQAVLGLQKEKLRSDPEHFCEYFLLNDINRIAIYGNDEDVAFVQSLIIRSDLSLVRIPEDMGFIPEADAILVTDKERFFFIEEDLMGLCDLPVISLWSVR